MKKVYDKPMVEIYSLNNADNTNTLQKSATVTTTGGKVGVYGEAKAWNQLH